MTVKAVATKKKLSLAASDDLRLHDLRVITGVES